MWDYKNIKQTHDSHLTSINASQYPKTIKFITPLLEKKQLWADIGGGKFNNSIELFKSLDVELVVYDPFNRSYEHNKEAVAKIANGKCDGVMINNVLNVIADKESRINVLKEAYNCLKENAYAFIVTYEGDLSGISKVTKNNTYQQNQKTSYYIEEIKSVFGEHVTIKNKIIVAKKEIQLTSEEELNNLIKESKKLGIQKTGKAGKLIGNSLYAHKTSMEIFPPKELKCALTILNKEINDFNYDIIKYNKETKAFSFIQSPDFDISSEPIVGDSLLISKEGVIKKMKQKTDPQIYHHKWLFVKNDYEGFNIKESIKRTIYWKTLLGVNKELSSKIGVYSFWKELERNGFKDLRKNLKF